MGNFCYLPCLEDQNKNKIELNPFYKDFKGQYNNYKEYSNFDLNISKKTLNNDQIEIEGVLIDKKGKSLFIGKVTKADILIETKIRNNDNYMREIIFQGNYNGDKKRYLGTFTTKNEKSSHGKFWISVIDNNFWMDTAVSGKVSSYTHDTNYSSTKKMLK